MYKTSARVKTDLYDFILQHPQFLQSPIENDCLKVYIGGHSENIWFQNFYYGYMSENFITAWLVHQKRVDLKKRGMKKII